MATGGGMTRIGKSLQKFPPLITPNYLFRNRGNLTFEELGGQWGFNSTNVPTAWRWPISTTTAISMWP
jgi:hypothetical protein